MIPTASVDTTKFNADMRRLARYVKKDMQELLPGEARLVAKEAMKITTPFGLNLASKKKGENAIRKDVFRGGRTGNSLFFSMPASVTTGQNRPDGKVFLFATSDKAYGTERRLFRPNASFSEMDDWHRKYGKKPGVRKFPRVPSDTIKGRFVKVNRMCVTGRALQRYVAKKIDRVGWAKAAWAAVYQRLGGKAVPAWISRHMLKTPHGRLDKSRLMTSAPEIVMSNSTAGIKDNVPLRTLQLAVDRRGHAMAKKCLNIVQGHSFDLRNGVVRTFKTKVKPVTE